MITLHILLHVCIWVFSIAVSGWLCLYIVTHVFRDTVSITWWYSDQRQYGITILFIKLSYQVYTDNLIRLQSVSTCRPINLNHVFIRDYCEQRFSNTNPSDERLWISHVSEQMRSRQHIKKLSTSSYIGRAVALTSLPPSMIVWTYLCKFDGRRSSMLKSADRHEDKPSSSRQFIISVSKWSTAPIEGRRSFSARAYDVSLRANFALEEHESLSWFTWWGIF